MASRNVASQLGKVSQRRETFPGSGPRSSLGEWGTNPKFHSFVYILVRRAILASVLFHVLWWTPSEWSYFLAVLGISSKYTSDYIVEYAYSCSLPCHLFLVPIVFLLPHLQPVVGESRDMPGLRAVSIKKETLSYSYKIINGASLARSRKLLLKRWQVQNCL